MHTRFESLLDAQQCFPLVSLFDADFHFAAEGDNQSTFLQAAWAGFDRAGQESHPVEIRGAVVRA